jgi:EAL domain-containing protein (putative c-di-GMP-specific phosphodiesterase class I)
MRVLNEDDENIASILRTIVALGRTLNLRVTAEGVETEEQARVLKMLKCDQLQGYHFGRPMPETDVAATILEHLRLTLSPPPIIKIDAA